MTYLRGHQSSKPSTKTYFSLVAASPTTTKMGLFDYRIGALLAISAVRTAAFAPALLPPSSSGTLLRESVVEQDEAGINDGASIASSPPSPGLDDDGKFECDDSVRFWRDFQVDGFATAQENARSLAEVSGRFANLGPDGLSYWVVSEPSHRLSLLPILPALYLNNAFSLVNVFCKPDLICAFSHNVICQCIKPLPTAAPWSDFLLRHQCRTGKFGLSA